MMMMMMMMKIIAQKKLSRGLFLEILAVGPQSFYHPRYQRHSLDGRRWHHLGEEKNPGKPTRRNRRVLGSGPKRPGSKPLSTGWGPKVVGQKLEPQKRKMGGKWDERWNIWWVYFFVSWNEELLTCCFFSDCKTFSFAFWEWLSGRCFGLFVSEFGLEPCFLLAKVASLVSQTSKTPEILNTMGPLRILELPNF